MQNWCHEEVRAQISGDDFECFVIASGLCLCVGSSLDHDLLQIFHNESMRRNLLRQAPLFILYLNVWLYK